MSSNADFVSAQRRLLNLFENGHTMSLEQELRAILGLHGVTQQMVRNRRDENRNHVTDIPTPGFRVVTPPTSSSRSPIGQPPEAERRYPPAELRPAVATRFTGHVRPSILLREINADIDVTPRRMSWEFYRAMYMKKRAIGKARFEANCSDHCAICLDTHTNGDTVLTECKHCFGKECWKNWMTNYSGNQTCPTCREHCPKVFSYTMKRPRSNAIVDDDISEITQEN